MDVLVNRARQAAQAAADIAVTVLVYLGVVRIPEDRPRPSYHARAAFPTAPVTARTPWETTAMTSPQDEPYDFDNVGRILHGVGSSSFKEMWPTGAREEWLRHQPEDFQQRFRANHADWLAKVDRYCAELDERAAEADRPNTGGGS
jgi:hypothetical protein